MHRETILTNLNNYANSWVQGTWRHATFDATEEAEKLTSFLNFATRYPLCFERDHLPGHFTGSAMVVSPDFAQVLLTLHGKLNIWLQLGGHADGDPLIHQVAMREAGEESGLTKLSFFAYAMDDIGTSSMPLPFDIDCHLIPERKTEPAHFHYDVRYIIVADPTEPLAISDESHALKWFTFTEARTITNERSMHRQFDKIEYLRTFLRRDAPTPTSGLTSAPPVQSKYDSLPV